MECLSPFPIIEKSLQFLIDHTVMQLSFKGARMPMTFSKAPGLSAT
jgi:hypothetical protein